MLPKIEYHHAGIVPPARSHFSPFTDLMGADQIAAIRPIVAELEEASREAAVSEYCGTFEVTGRKGLWVELLLGSVNCAYPFLDDPLVRVSELALEPLPGLSLAEWEPGKFATFDYDRTATRREVARFIDGWFDKVLGCGDEYPLEVSIMSLT